MITEKGESDLSEPITLNTPFEQTEIGIFMDEVYGRFFMTTSLVFKCCNS